MSRISPGTILLGIVAILFGLLGAYIVRKHLAGTSPQVQAVEAAKPVTVPVASAALKAGREITLGDIALLKLTPEQMKKQGITNAFMSNTRQIIGRVLQQDLKQGATFDTNSFYPEGTGPSVADRLTPGMRAVTISVELDAAVIGFANAGSWVDVLFRRDAEADVPETTITLLRGVQVLALERDTTEGTAISPRRAPGGNTSVTLGVKPHQVAALRVVEDRGTLSLALRHPDDLNDEDTIAPKTLDELLDRPTDNRQQMEVYRGRQRSNIEFQDDETFTSKIDRFTKMPSANATSQQPLAFDTPPRE